MRSVTTSPGDEAYRSLRSKPSQACLDLRISGRRQRDVTTRSLRDIRPAVSTAPGSSAVLGLLVAALGGCANNSTSGSPAGTPEYDAASGTDSTNSGDDAGAADAAQIAVYCESDTASSLQDPICDCQGSGASGEIVYSGVACDSSTTEGSFGTLCCESNEYPNDGGSCSCYETGNWQCWTYSDMCGCSYYGAPFGSVPDSTECNNAPGSDGLPWTCCASSSDCTCSESISGCGSDTVVSDCLIGPAALGVQPPFTSCPNGTDPVSSCSTGPTEAPDSGADDDSGGGGGCNASNCGGPPSCYCGVCCSQSCQGGVCMSNCSGSP
jgi:hypothetical protein